MDGAMHCIMQVDTQKASLPIYTAIGLDPKSVSGRTLFNILGSSYAAVEMFNDAIKCFTQALEMGLEKSEVELCTKSKLADAGFYPEERAKDGRGIEVEFILTTTDLLVGVLLLSATLFSGTRMLASGKYVATQPLRNIVLNNTPSIRCHLFLFKL